MTVISLREACSQLQAEREITSVMRLPSFGPPQHLRFPALRCFARALGNRSPQHHHLVTRILPSTLSDFHSSTLVSPEKCSGWFTRSSRTAPEDKEAYSRSTHRASRYTRCTKLYSLRSSADFDIACRLWPSSHRR